MPLIKLLQRSAHNILINIPRCGMLYDGLPHYERFGLKNDRFVVLSPETCLLDLVLCLESAPMVKTQKRIERGKFILKVLENKISISTKVKFNSMVESLKNIKDGIKNGVEDDDKQIEELKGCLHSMEYIVEERLFKKHLPSDTYTVPITKQFHDFCKSKLNCDGFVYDIFTYIAILSFNELVHRELKSKNNSLIRRMLISEAKLIFKGGASIGKFIFMADGDLWDSLSDEDKDFVKDNFINGGDNDTSISFYYLPTGIWSTEKINEEIKSILYDMENIVFNNIFQYNIEHIINDYLFSVIEEKMEFAGKKFSFRRRKARSFALVDKDGIYMEYIPINNEKTDLFGSISYHEFTNQKKEKVKFFLGRIKAGYTAVLNETEDISFNCYAECLDISACCADTASSFKVEHIPIMFNAFIEE